MKIELWCFNQSSTGMLDKPVRTEVSFVTNDDVDRNTLLEHIKLYDTTTTELIDTDFYWRMKKFAEEVGFNFLVKTPADLKSRYVNATQDY